MNLLRKNTSTLASQRKLGFKTHRVTASPRLSPPINFGLPEY
jgi:hypothetical protein